MNQNRPTAPSDTTTGPDTATISRYLLPLDGPTREDLLAALRSAADTSLAALTCPPCAAGVCPDAQHQPRLQQIRAWRNLATDIARLPATDRSDEPLIHFDADACRAWLLAGAADTAGIDDGFSTEDLTIAAGLDELLSLLNTDATQHAWRPAPHVQDVLIWRTADGDGVDGGGVLTVDLNYLGERVRLASLHQGFDDFTADAATSGTDAAVEALAHVAAILNREHANLLRATAYPPSDATDETDNDGAFTVVGVWVDDEPIPVGVIAGRHDVSGGDGERFGQGVWAATVDADDERDAEQAAVAVVREHDQ
ncbi:hypothetical protein GCM10009687_60630 [Asanoa iriomotensis]|uniref:hypothetical protein n=3 Tax=Asanoa iriomotensis TaxID=234613 RepID=UPI0031DB1FE0